MSDHVTRFIRESLLIYRETDMQQLTLKICYSKGLNANTAFASSCKKVYRAPQRVCVCLCVCVCVCVYVCVCVHCSKMLFYLDILTICYPFEVLHQLNKTSPNCSFSMKISDSVSAKRWK